MTDTPTIALAAGFPAADDAQWRALVDKVLKGADFRKRLVSRTADGIEIEPLYTGTPGASTGVGGRSDARPGGWRIAQVRAETTPEALSAAAIDDIENGAEAITIRLASPGQTGLPVAALDEALQPLPLDKVVVSLEPGMHALAAAQTLWQMAQNRRATGAIGRLGCDPLGTLARTGELVAMSPDGRELARDVLQLPETIAALTADARPYHEAGASEAQEVAALAATLVAYLRALEQGGLAPSTSLHRIALSMAADADLFLTMAKLRAARRLVGGIGEACGAAEAAARMPLAVTTSERMMARRDPWVNMLRTTAACTAAAMGGADEIAVLPFTWALGQTDAFASRNARNVGLVLREESGLGRIADPAGGSWAVERLTEELSAKAWAIFQEWEGEGGMLAALKSGLVQDQIAAVADARSKDVATRKLELTGVSAFPQLADDGVKITPWPAAPALTDTPLVRRLTPRRLAAPFEALRDAADAMPSKPTVFLASLGTQSDHAARSMWITTLLAAGGIGAITSDGFTSSQHAGRAFAESGTKIACICGSDQSYAELAEATAMALKGAGAAHVYLAGRPREQETALKAAGVDGFLYAGMDVVGALQKLLAQTA